MSGERPTQPEELKVLERRTTRRQLLRIGAAGIAAAAVSPLLQACTSAPQDAAPSQPKSPSSASAPAVQSKPSNQGGTLVAAGDSMGENFYPTATNPGWTHLWAVMNIYDTLYTTRDLKTYTPQLALSHSVSPDGLVYTFQLRKGVKFHDGTPFNAEAVQFHFMRMIDKNHPYYEPGAATRTNVIPDVKEVKATGEYEVQFIRDKPMAGQLALLSGAYAGIVSPESVKKYGKDYTAHPVGTGPFIFEKAEKGSMASLVANPDYWAGRPSLDRVVIRVINDDQTMTASLLSGDVDITQYVDFKDLDTFRKNPKLKVVTVPAASTGYVGIMSQKPQVSDVRVRRAICHAINAQQIIDTIFYGEADIGGGQVPLALFGHAPQFKDYYKYDPQKAQDLLKEAGGPQEFVLYTQNSGFWPRMAELVQADLNAVGFKVTIEKTDPGKFYGQMTEGKHAAYLGDATYNVPDPDEQFWGHYGCENPRSKRIGHCDRAFDELLAKQAAEKDWEKRKQMLWDLQKMQLDTVAHAPLYNYRFMTVSNKRVEGYEPMPVRLMFLDKTYVTKK